MAPDNLLRPWGKECDSPDSREATFQLRTSSLASRKTPTAGTHCASPCSRQRARVCACYVSHAVYVTSPHRGSQRPGEAGGRLIPKSHLRVGCLSLSPRSPLRRDERLQSKYAARATGSNCTPGFGVSSDTLRGFQSPAPSAWLAETYLSPWGFSACGLPGVRAGCLGLSSAERCWGTGCGRGSVRPNPCHSLCPFRSPGSLPLLLEPGPFAKAVHSPWRQAVL